MGKVTLLLLRSARESQDLLSLLASMTDLLAELDDDSRGLDGMIEVLEFDIVSGMSIRNIYFELTEELNAHRRIAVLGSGQAVVHYRLAIMSKDGDWILREDEGACKRVLEALARRRARYRPGAPLDIRWLAGGWSSHFEFQDERGRRVRCDFFSRPPRLPAQVVADLFAEDAVFDADERPVIGVEELVLMKQTQRAKDYPIIGELARRLPPEREIELTTDPDRIVDLAPIYGRESTRPSVRSFLEGGRLGVVRALAEEIDEMQLRDRDRMTLYHRASVRYRQELQQLSREQLSLPTSHRRLCDLAQQYLPEQLP